MNKKLTLLLLPLLLLTSCAKTTNVIVKEPDIYNNVKIVKYNYTYEMSKGNKKWDIPFNYITISNYKKGVREYELNINNTLYDYSSVGHTNGVPFVLHIYYE